MDGLGKTKITLQGEVQIKNKTRRKEPKPLRNNLSCDRNQTINKV